MAVGGIEQINIDKSAIPSVNSFDFISAYFLLNGKLLFSDTNI